MLPDHLGTTKQEAATAMRRLEETTVAAMIGWAKAAAEVEKLAAERDRAKGIAEGLHTELRDAVAARGQAERERDAHHEFLSAEVAASRAQVEHLSAEVRRLTVELACMTAERDGYRDQLAADWQAKQISDLMAAAGQARSERDEAQAALARVREYVGGELVFTNAEMSALADCCDDHYEECAAVWRGYFLRVVLAALDGSGT